MASNHNRSTRYRFQRMLVLVLVIGALISACETNGGSPTSPPATAALAPLPQAVPTLPFADNPDPDLCGVPAAWHGGNPAWVTGVYAGALVQPVVLLYDSHLRREVVGRIPHGGRVEIQLSQSNPELDFYRVRSLDLQPVQEGWLPAPFLSFESAP